MPVAYRNISLSVILIILGVQWGFYKNYSSQFPDFINKTYIIHIHGMLWMSWLVLLVIQPFLIQTGRIQLHRKIGQLAYIIGPALIIFLYLAGRESYGRFMAAAPEPVALKFIVLDARGLISFTIFWSLAMFYRKDSAAHMRYMIASGLLAIGPGVGRGLVNSFHFDFDSVFKTLDLINLAITGALLANDLYRKKNAKPFLLIFIVFLAGAILWQIRNTEAWRLIAKSYANLFY